MYRLFHIYMFILLLTAGCGQSKIPGSIPAGSNVSLKVQYLYDSKLPLQSDHDLNESLLRASELIKNLTAQNVKFELLPRKDIDTAFKSYVEPLGKFSMANRFSLTDPVDDTFTVYIRTAVDRAKQTGRLQGIMPAVGLHPDVVAMDLIYERFTRTLKSGLKEITMLKLPDGTPFTNPAFADRRSVYIWYLIMNTWNEPSIENGGTTTLSRPADVILTNDILIFDSLMSIPAHTVVSSLLTTGYTRIFPGVSIISLLPFWSDDQPFKSWQTSGKTGVSDKTRIELTARAIAHEVGTRSIGLEESEYSSEYCGRRPVWPNYQTWLKTEQDQTQCVNTGNPIDRLAYRRGYLTFKFNFSIYRDDIKSAEFYLKQLENILGSSDPVVVSLADKLRKVENGT